MPKLRTFIAVLCCCIPLLSKAQKASYQPNKNGVILTFKNSPTSIDQRVNLEFIQDNIIHVKSMPLNSITKATVPLSITDSLPPHAGAIDLNEDGDKLILRSKSLQLIISLLTGKINFLNPSGDTILKEKQRDMRAFNPAIANGDTFFQVRQDFEVTNKEGLYGLGQHQNGIMNYQGRQTTLLQYNTEVAVPFLISTKNYGILWNNYSITRAGDVRPLLPLSALQLFAKSGEEGWLTATYLDKENEKNVFTSRAESDIAFNDLSDLYKFPDSVDLSKTLVRYEGAFRSPLSGKQRFHFKYAGYIKVWIDGKLVQDRWRESWNAGTFELDLTTTSDQKHSIRIDWKPEGAQSYLGINWQRPIPVDEENLFSFDSEAGDGIDYYFMNGANMDEVIGGYRLLTGKAPIMPKWAFGYWQSRERYKTQQEIEEVAKAFRSRKIPIDNLVLDWSYWPEKDWGSQDFDLERFPDVSKMVKDLHQNHYHLMISTWPKFNEASATYPEFMKNGWLYRRNIADARKDWIGKGYTSTFYDPFNEAARKGFWTLLNEKLYQKGVDAFWMDASEPDIHSNISLQERKDVFQPAIGSSTRYYNAFPLQNAKGIYEGQRGTDPNKRVFMLTRSGFTGQQRYAAATWSGDIASTWEDMKDQIAAGINFSMSGLPYWTMDAGGFLVEKRYYQPNTADQEEWRELNSRWYQFGAFIPIFRAHGQFPFREPFHIAPEDHPSYKSMVYYIRLRYRLLPYIYSLAGKTFHNNYSILRGLAMDFSADSATYNINDQFMLGPSLLVNPVTVKGVDNRPVYLPKGSSWYDLYQGKSYQGNQHITAAAPYERIPVFVKAGTILPIGPIIQHTAEKTDEPITLYVYDGADGEFTLYEDDGVSYNYEKGNFSSIALKYDNTTKQLILSERKGKFTEEQQVKKIRIIWVNMDQEYGIDSQAKAHKTITYKGKYTKIKLTNKG